MISFEDMMGQHSSTIIGEQLKDVANMVFDETFSNSTTYRQGDIYDCNLNKIKKYDFKFIKTRTYTMEKDQVEYWIQFRPGVNPEVDLDTSKDQKHRFGYYIDVLDDNTKLYEKWLIVGKDTSEFDRYNVLKCNWLFEWLDDERIYRKCLGCVRDRNNYNSGVWSDGFSTSVENQTSFIIPTNDHTRGLDYGKRFMITDNMQHPKTYEVTKLMDTFPLGTIKVILSQSHYNEHVDLCGVNEKFFKDEEIHMICNFYESNLRPYRPIIEKIPTTWKLIGGNDKLYVNGQPQVIQAVPSDTDTTDNCEWHIFVDGEDYTDKLEELQDYLDIIFNNVNHTITIAAINKDLANYVISIKIYDETRTYYDFVEMEVEI